MVCYHVVSHIIGILLYAEVGYKMSINYDYLNS